MGRVRMLSQGRAVVVRDTAGLEDMDTAQEEEEIVQGMLDQVDMDMEQGGSE